MILSAMTTEFDFAPAQKGFFARLFDRLVEARQKETQLMVNHYLLKLSDEELKAVGYDRKTLQAQGSKLSIL